CRASRSRRRGAGRARSRARRARRPRCRRRPQGRRARQRASGRRRGTRGGARPVQSARSLRGAAPAYSTTLPAHQLKGGAMEGKLVNSECPARDGGRAKGFWSGVFGWEFSEPMGMEYWMTQNADGQGGAVFPSDSTELLAYFDTDDIDATLGKVRD